MMLVLRLWYWINYSSSNWYFSIFSSHVCLILYQYCKEKFCLDHIWELKCEQNIDQKNVCSWTFYLVNSCINWSMWHQFHHKFFHLLQEIWPLFGVLTEKRHHFMIKSGEIKKFLVHSCWKRYQCKKNDVWTVKAFLIVFNLKSEY